MYTYYVYFQYFNLLTRTQIIYGGVKNWCQALFAYMS